MKRDRARALLVWPGGLFAGGANFGVPQLLAIAAAMKASGDVDVDVVDLDAERALGRVDLDALIDSGERPYDLVGISCYSSYDYLKVCAIASRVRAKLPRAWIVTGGYHPSARPDDFTGPTSPFDFVVVGDGEAPMARLASAVVSGKRPLLRVLGPESVGDLGAMPPIDWELLARYRPVARRVASQAEIYLSRGCPYDCAFCMERAKRDTSWRALDPLHAVEEMHRLDRFLDLSTWTLFIADALFGMKTSWRRTFLEELARRPVRARKIWLLVRLDLLEREDLALMARANVGAGFGLESGDPDQVRRIRKVGRLSDYLDQMLRVAEWARDLGVPWGANVIVGHPGETEQTIRTTAKYLERLFLADPRGTTGFLSVDPFRLYPGSPIDEERAEWEERTGVRVHRYPWWHDGDQDFLAEWVDPSHELDFRKCHALRHELFLPIVEGIAKSFTYDGPATDYFRRAITEQIDLLAPRHAARTLALDHLWRSVARAQGIGGGAPRLRGDEAGATTPGGPLAVSDDDALAAFSRAARSEALHLAEGAPEGDDAIARAVRDVPRERFVPLAELPDAHLDRALPLDDEGLATISAMHAYIATFRALELGPGDSLVDLGGGSGYGAAIAAAVVGPRGRITSLEIDAALVERAKRALEGLRGGAEVCMLAGDAHDVAAWAGARKVSVGFDVGVLPEAWAQALAPGGRLVAPVAGCLVVVDKSDDGAVTRRSLGPVVYVGDRSERREIERPEPAPMRILEADAPSPGAE